jgi:CubicO group peptidase (beta-lactamase class C family)
MVLDNSNEAWKIEMETQVETSLVCIDANAQPQWGKTSKLSERMSYYKAPGTSIAVINNYQLGWVKGYGVLAVNERTAVTTETLFHAGSVAKPISAAATLTLVQQDLLNLDDEVNKRLKSWQIPENEYASIEKIKLRHLLSHSAGLKDGLTNRGPDESMPKYVTFGNEIPSVTIQQLLDGIPEDEIEPTQVFQVPGINYRYANADYGILELLVEDILEQPFEDFMQAAILDRLGMNNSSYFQPLPNHLRANVACEHTVNGEPVEGGRANFPFHAAGSLWTTPTDLAVFMIDLMKAHQGETGHLLSPQLAQEMLSPQIKIRNSPLSDSYGLVVELQNTNQGLKVWHSGGTWGSSCVIWFYPQLGKGAAVMTNSASLLPFEVLLSIALTYDWPMG